VVSDGQTSIRRAVERALPGVAHQLCHFHFLREAALPIFEADRHANNWLRVLPGRQICLKAAAKLDFQPLSPGRVKSDFWEGWNGWKPSWASDSHAIGCRIV
jgi:hypothetical protein